MEKLDVQELLQQGISAAKAAQRKTSPAEQQAFKDQARRLLLQVTELDDANLQAWLWLSAVMDDLIDKFTCLERVLTLDPNNQAAQAGLKLLKQQVASPAYAKRDEVKSSSLPDKTASSAVQATSSHPPPRTHPWLEKSYQDSDWYRLEEAITPAPPSAPKKQPPQATCPFCHKPIGNMDTTCPHCELPLVMDCPKCNTLMDIERPACTQCGYEMGDYRLGSVYFTQLAIAYQKYKRLPKALNALQVAEKISPDQPDLYRQMGEVQAELGHISAAIATLQQAVEQEPEQIAPYLSLGKVLQQEGSWEKAEQIYRRALKVLPKSSESHYALGDLFLQRGQPAKARQHLERATGLNPYNGMAWSRLGQLYESAGKRKQAVRAYRQAAKWLPQDLLEWHRVEERLKVLDPPLPEGLRRGWFEFIRQMIGPVLVAVLAVLLDSGLRPWWIHWTGWLALSLATLGALLWLSGTSLPQNPVIRFFTGPGGLEDSAMRLLLAICGVLFWLLAIAVILWPVGQSLPELPF